MVTEGEGGRKRDAGRSLGDIWGNLSLFAAQLALSQAAWTDRTVPLSLCLCSWHPPLPTHVSPHIGQTSASFVGLWVFGGHFVLPLSGPSFSHL